MTVFSFTKNHYYLFWYLESDHSGVHYPWRCTTRDVFVDASNRFHLVPRDVTIY